MISLLVHSEVEKKKMEEKMVVFNQPNSAPALSSASNTHINKHKYTHPVLNEHTICQPTTDSTEGAKCVVPTGCVARTASKRSLTARSGGQHPVEEGRRDGNPAWRGSLTHGHVTGQEEGRSLQPRNLSQSITVQRRFLFTGKKRKHILESCHAHGRLPTSTTKPATNAKFWNFMRHNFMKKTQGDIFKGREKNHVYILKNISRDWTITQSGLVW